MTLLVIKDLWAEVGGTSILKGVNLEIDAGEVHIVMGPNGAGKSTLSHILMGKPGYTVTKGSITLDGEDLLSMATYERARAGLFLSMQYPTEVPGVSMIDMLESSQVVSSSSTASREQGRDDLRTRLGQEATRIGLSAALLERPLNVDMSGGEKKRNETVQMAVLEPRIAILDEIDSGLDVDALSDVARRVEAATQETGLAVLAITHYSQLLGELNADSIHILVDGKVVKSGGSDLAAELEKSGYGPYLETAPTS